MVKSFSALLLIMLSKLISTSSVAQTFWTGAADDNWNNSLNWNPQVIPDSTTRVIIELNTSNPQPRWPHLGQDTKAGRIICRNAEMSLNSFNLQCFNFSLINSTVYCGSDTGSVILINNRDSLKAINFMNSRLHDPFRLLVHFRSEVTMESLESDDLVIESGDGVNSTINIVDSCRFNGNVVFNFPNFGDSFLPKVKLNMRSATVAGNLGVFNRSGTDLFLGPQFSFWPDVGVKVLGKIEIESSHPMTNYLVLHRVENETGGGKIKHFGGGGIWVVKSTIRVDSIYAESTGLSNLIDSSTLFSDVRLLSHTLEPPRINPPQETRISASKFYGKVFVFDSLENINETRGLYKLPLPITDLYGSANSYYNDVHFKGKVNLGMLDTSFFHGNLTIESLDGSVFTRAKFVGDQPADINIGQTPLQFAIVDKVAPSLLNVTSPLNISGFMRFDNGKVKTNPGSYIKFLPGAIAENFGAHSYVNGEVQKEGDAAFIFPVGSGNGFKPLAMSAPSNVSDVISVRYNASDVSAIADTSQRAATLPTVGNCEYWDVQQLNGNSDVTLSPAWDEPCLDNTIYFTDPQNVRIARWNNNAWEDAGNGGYNNGMISTSSAIAANGLFTFASTKRQVSNPEPPQPPSMIIFPNPAHQTVNIVVEPDYKQGIIIDAIGRRISVHQMQTGLNSIDVSMLPSGVYFLKLITTRTQRVLKWIKL